MKQLFTKVCLLVAFCCMNFLLASGAAHADQIKIFDEYRSAAPATFQFEANIPAISAGQQARLALDARIDSPSLLGSNPWIIVKVNDAVISRTDLLNKPNSFFMRNGLEITWYAARTNAWRVLYSPDFKKAYDPHETYAPVNTDPYHYLWNITPYVHPGKNTIEITHLKVLPNPATLVLQNGAIETGTPILPPATVQAAPTGPLETITARKTPSFPISVEGAPGALKIKAGNQNFMVQTRTSLPDGKWWQPDTKSVFSSPLDSAALSWTTPLYSVQRKIQVQDHRVTVSDTFTNRTNQMIGVLIEHQLAAPQPSAFFLTGFKVLADQAIQESSSNPSAFVDTEQGGAALLAEGDIFRAHAAAFRRDAIAGLADQHLGIGPYASVTLQWAIYPLPRGTYEKGDYWDFVNAVRGDWHTNFTLPGPFNFVFHKEFAKRTLPEIKQWLSSRQVKIISGDIPTYADGQYAHGTGILFAPEWVNDEKAWVSKVHQSIPGIKVLCYFHAQISSEPDAAKKYAADRDHDVDGKEMSYPSRSSDMPIFIPTVNNAYGKALWGSVKTITDTIGADGLYWDEMTHSINAYASNAPWDGCSAQIDLTTHQLIKPLSNIPLLVQPLRLQILDYLRRHGKYFMANTQAATQTMMQQNIVRFVETGSYSTLPGAVLECPLGLANNQPENSQAAIAQDVREMLERGCYYYGWTYRREVPSRDFEPLLYPMTPQRLGTGFVIGTERMVTAVSGNFAFADGARGDVYEVDENGAEVKQSGVKEQKTGDHYSYEVRIPSNHFVIIVRR